MAPNPSRLISDVERPTTVVIGVFILLGCASLALVGLFFVPPAGSRWITGVILVVNFVLPVAVWSRRNWARVVLLVLFLLGLLGTLLSLYVLRRFSIPLAGPLVRGMLLTQSVGQAIGLACLFKI